MATESTVQHRTDGLQSSLFSSLRFMDHHKRHQKDEILSTKSPERNQDNVKPTPISSDRARSHWTSPPPLPATSRSLRSRDIRARLERYSRQTPHASEIVRYIDRGASDLDSPSDFFIQAVPTSSNREQGWRAGSQHLNGSQGKPGSLSSMNAHSRINQLQAELKLRDMEVHRLASTVALARRERDQMAEDIYKAKEENARLQSSSREVNALRQQQKELMLALKAQEREVACLRSYLGPLKPRDVGSRDSDASHGDEGRLVEQRETPGNTHTDIIVREMKTELERKAVEGSLSAQLTALQHQVESAAEEIQQHRARADAAEERAHMLQAELEAKTTIKNEEEERLGPLKRELSALRNDMKRLEVELANTVERAELAEKTLSEERERHNVRQSRFSTLMQHDAITPTSVQAAGSSTQANNMTLEEALTHQVRVLAEKLQLARAEAVAARNMAANASTVEKESEPGKEVPDVHSLVEANKELELALSHAVTELDAQSDQLTSARSELARLSSENEALLEKISRHEIEEARARSTERELLAAKERIAQLEEAVASTSCRSPSRDGASSPRERNGSSLREMVGSLRSELHERELRLAAVEEELAASRRKQAELHEQALDQAVELDELQNVVDEMEKVRDELENARHQEKEARRLVEELEDALARKASDSLEVEEPEAARRELADVVTERDQLKIVLEEKETVIMTLEGQVTMLQRALDEKASSSFRVQGHGGDVWKEESNAPGSAIGPLGLDIESWLMGS